MVRTAGRVQSQSGFDAESQWPPQGSAGHHSPDTTANRRQSDTREKHDRGDNEDVTINEHDRVSTGRDDESRRAWQVQPCPCRSV